MMAMSNRIGALEDALQIECTTRQALERQLGSREHDIVGEADVDLHVFKERMNDAQGLPGFSSRSNKASLFNVHPLLVPDLLQIKQGLEIPTTSVDEDEDAGETLNSEDEPISEMIDTFGMLAIQNGHNALLVGAYATEVCFSVKPILTVSDVPLRIISY